MAEGIKVLNVFVQQVLTVFTIVIIPKISWEIKKDIIGLTYLLSFLDEKTYNSISPKHVVCLF